MKFRTIVPAIMLAGHFLLSGCGDSKLAQQNTSIKTEVKESLNNNIFESVFLKRGAEVGNGWEEEIQKAFDEIKKQDNFFKEESEKVDIRDIHAIAKYINDYSMKKGYLFMYYANSNEKPFIKIEATRLIHISEYPALRELFPEILKNDTVNLKIANIEESQGVCFLGVPVVGINYQFDYSIVVNELLHHYFYKYNLHSISSQKVQIGKYNTTPTAFEEFCSNAVSIKTIVNRKKNLGNFSLLEEDIDIGMCWKLKTDNNQTINVEEYPYYINRKFGTEIFIKYLSTEEKVQLEKINNKYSALISTDFKNKEDAKSFILLNIQDKDLEKEMREKFTKTANSNDLADELKSIVIRQYAKEIEPLTQSFLTTTSQKQREIIANEYMSRAKQFVGELKKK